jgi:hypothetical protein
MSAGSGKKSGLIFIFFGCARKNAVEIALDQMNEKLGKISERTGFIRMGLDLPLLADGESADPKFQLFKNNLKIFVIFKKFKIFKTFKN